MFIGGKENNSLLDDDTYGIKIISLLAPLEKAGSKTQWIFFLI